MHDPDIINLEMPLREVKAIKLMIFDDTKNMTFDERSVYFKTGVDDICSEFNIRLVSSINERPHIDYNPAV